MKRLFPIVRGARRSFRGSLEARLAAVIAVAVLAGGTAGVLPAVVGRAVAAVSGAKDVAAPGGIASEVARRMPEGAWAVVATTLAATALVVGVGVFSSQLSSSLAGDLTAAMRIELMRAVVGASARSVGRAGAAIVQPRLPPGMAPPGGASPAPGKVSAPPGAAAPGGLTNGKNGPPLATAASAAAAPPDGAARNQGPLGVAPAGTAPPGKALPGKAPPGKAAVDPGEAQRAAIVQLAVSREAGLVGEFVVSLLTSLPQAVATMAVLAFELISGGAWIVLVGGSALFVTSRLLADRASRRVAHARRDLQTADAAVFGNLQETLSALEDLRLWGAREQAVAEFATRSYACADARRSFSAAMAVSGQIKSVFTAMSPLLVVLALELGGRAVGPGEVAKLLLLVPLLVGRLEVLDGVRQGLIERGPVLDATLDLLALEPAPSRAAGARRLALDAVAGELVFEDVAFTPPGAERPVLDGVTLRIPAGAIVGICGPSGCGKSTLLRLVLRLDDPDRGRILLDGVDVRDVEPEQLHELFGVLRQSSQLFERKLRENLAMGLRAPPTDDAMRQTLRLLDLSEFAGTEGARGLDMVVRRHPPNVSGGEARRLLLARMLLGTGRVQLLDEPEAGLPSATAEELLASVARSAQGRTHLVVTHAPHLLRSDFNVVLKDGRIVATGSHEELAAGCEVYRGLLAESLKGASAPAV